MRRNGEKLVIMSTKKRIYLVILSVLLLLLTTLWLIWLLRPVSDEEAAYNDVTLTVLTRYVLSVDSVDLIAFPQTEGDSLLIHAVEASSKKVRDEQSYAPAEWIRRFGLLPYCGGTMAVESADTSRLCAMSSEQIRNLLHHQEQITANDIIIAHEQRNDIDYYMKTHTVTDNGFDIVARYGEVLTAKTDSIMRLDTLIKKALSGNGNLRVRMVRNYYINTYKGPIACIPTESNDSVTLLRLQPTTAHEEVDVEGDLFTRLRHSRLTADDALKRLANRHPKAVKVHYTHIDSIGHYTGNRDSVMQPHGYGRFISHKGDFYEGEWQHGKREGVGFSMVPGKRLMLGEWKQDRFLGERITYTPERIYGIDISRFQHEHGRKRYAIDWRNLRITSLGTISKKTIKGAVNYPVSFIYIKATEGTTIKSRYFASDYAAARKHGYRTGAYHFFSILSPGASQAEYFLKNSRYTRGDLPPVLDLEPTDAQIRKAGGEQQLFNSVRTWLRIVEQRRGVRPILYVSQSFVNRHLSAAPDIKKKYDVWIARYGEYKPDVNLVYWQLCPDGRVNGIHGTVDINVYNGFSMK